MLAFNWLWRCFNLILTIFRKNEDLTRKWQKLKSSSSNNNDSNLGNFHRTPLNDVTQVCCWLCRVKHSASTPSHIDLFVVDMTDSMTIICHNILANDNIQILVYNFRRDITQLQVHGSLPIPTMLLSRRWLVLISVLFMVIIIIVIRTARKNNCKLRRWLEIQNYQQKIFARIRKTRRNRPSLYKEGVQNTIILPPFQVWPQSKKM